MSEKNLRILNRLISLFNTLLLVAYFGGAYFLANLLLNSVVPRIVPTTRVASDFWIFGVGALLLCAGSLAAIKFVRNYAVSAKFACATIIIGVLLEGFIFIGAICIWTEAGMYADWVGQFGIVAATSGTDMRYWVAATLVTHGIFGNLLSGISDSILIK